LKPLRTSRTRITLRTLPALESLCAGDALRSLVSLRADSALNAGISLRTLCALCPLKARALESLESLRTLTALRALRTAATAAPAGDEECLDRRIEETHLGTVWVFELLESALEVFDHLLKLRTEASTLRTLHARLTDRTLSADRALVAALAGWTCGAWHSWITRARQPSLALRSLPTLRALRTDARHSLR